MPFLSYFYRLIFTALMEAYILKALGVVLLSALKYAVGFFAALGGGFSFVEILLFNLGGGMLGTVLYLYLWEVILKVYRRFFPKKEYTGIKINKFIRFIVIVIRKFKLYGVAFLTPILLSVPIGVVISTSIEPNKWKIKRFMFVSFLCWTLFFYGLYSLFDIRVDELI